MIGFSQPTEDPYEGRSAIKVGNIGEFDQDLARKIDAFNDTNESYYVVPVYCELPDNAADSSVYNYTVVTDNVEYDEYSTSVIVTELDDYNAYLANLEGEEEAIVAYLNGNNAPDIMVTNGNHRGITDDVFFEDLTEYMNNDEALDEEDLFSNIIDAAKTDGKLYQMPLRFYINGIAVYKGDDTQTYNATGISYSDYSDLVNVQWNGEDPILTVCDPLEYTAPEGLLGEFRINALVLGVIAAATASVSGWKVSGSVGTGTTFPPWFPT